MSTRFGSWDEKTVRAQAKALSAGLARLKREARNRAEVADYFREQARQLGLFGDEDRKKATEAFAVKQRQVIVGRITRILSGRGRRRKKT